MLWPIPPDSRPRELSDADLEAIYAYPGDLAGPWVQVNFVSSADGAASIDGVSKGLSHPADRRVLSLQRDLADVILLGAHTATRENYVTIKQDADRRRRLELSDRPRIAVVSNTASFPPDAALVTSTDPAPIVYTCAAAPEERTQALRAAGVEVVVTGGSAVDLPAVLRDLAGRGLRRVDCEGGPQLMAGMLAADLVDQLCLTISPLLAGAGADRIAAGTPSDAPRKLRLESVLQADDFLMLRYQRARSVVGTNSSRK